VPISELIQVYSGSFTFQDSDHWITIQLDQPYIYTGGNLVVAVLNNSGSYPTCGVNNGKFNYHTATSKTLHYRVDGSTPIDPENLTEATAIHSGRNNIIFNYCDELPPSEFSLNPDNIVGEGATITLEPDPIPYGENGTAYFTTTNECYSITDVIIDDEHYGAIASYEFVNVIAPLPIIEVVTSIYQYEISAVSGENGTIDPSGTVSVICSENQTFTFTPIDGFILDKVLVDGFENTEAVQNGYYTFENVMENHTIQAFFKLPVPCGDIIIGDGAATTYEIPFNTFYLYSYTQQIYEASEIELMGDDVKITEISFQYVYNMPTNRVLTVYLSITNKTSFESLIDWVPFSQLQQVFQGEVLFNNANEWTTIHFQTPFEYSGGNIVVAILNNDDSNTPSTGLTFRMHTDATNKTLHFRRSDVGPINPANPVEASGLFSNRSNMMLHICGESLFPDFSLNPDNIVGEGAAITLVPDPIPYGENGTAYFTTTNDCFHITDVIIDGEHFGSIASYEFVHVTAPLPVIEVVTSLIQYEINLILYLNGTIQNTGGGTYNCGTNITFSFPPIVEYEIEKVLIDGVENTGAAQCGCHTFENIMANHTIEVFLIPKSSVNEQTINEISIYSNANIVHIVNEKNLPINEVTIFDMYGHIVWQGKPQEQITLNVANGIYTARLTSNDTSISTKIVIQR
jgi:hypothetical protein